MNLRLAYHPEGGATLKIIFGAQGGGQGENILAGKKGVERMDVRLAVTTAMSKASEKKAAKQKANEHHGL